MFQFVGSTESFSHLCLIQGILSHASDQTLAFVSAETDQVIDTCGDQLDCHVDDKFRSACFLLKLLPAIKWLCVSARFKYHAFRLLELWLTRLKSICSSEYLLFASGNLASVESDLLKLLAGHMDCSVDGVPELIGDILNSVLQLDKLVNQHASGCAIAFIMSVEV